jgi:hypothetical protein
MKKRRFWYDTEFIEYPSTIDLISIGIVADDGREFYGINFDCDFEQANPWVRQNVLNQLPDRPLLRENVKGPWMSKPAMRQAVFDFFRPSKANPFELWGYYADYDHVALCWLFGPMAYLPPGMPMYTLDIKQLAVSLGNPKLPEQGKGEHNALADAKWNKYAWEFLMELKGTPNPS